MNRFHRLLWLGAGLLIARCTLTPVHAHVFSAIECNAGAGVVGDIVRARDAGIDKDRVYRWLDELQVQARGTAHELDAHDVALFKGYTDVAYLHTQMTRDDAWFQFYTACKAQVPQ